MRKSTDVQTEDGWRWTLNSFGLKGDTREVELDVQWFGDLVLVSTPVSLENSLCRFHDIQLKKKKRNTF